MANNYVYFLKNPATGEIKIGKSKDPYNRQRDIEISAGHSLELLLIIENDDLERILHVKFRKHRTHGEWFAPHNELLEYIKEYQKISCESNEAIQNQREAANNSLQFGIVALLAATFLAIYALIIGEFNDVMALPIVFGILGLGGVAHYLNWYKYKPENGHRHEREVE